MSLMYEVNTINAAMIQAAEICCQDMPEAEKVNAVLACFAGMKPVEAVRVVRCEDCKWRGTSYSCPLRHLVFTEAEGYHYVDATMDDGYCYLGAPKEVEA
jgi:hypothetical protein